MLLSLTSGQLARGHRVHVAAVLTPGAGNHPFVDGLRQRGVPVTVIEVPERGYVEERRRVAELCRSVSADVLHTHGYRPDVAVAGVARALRIPRVTTVHGFCAGGWKGRLYEWLQVQSYRRFDGVIAVAKPQIKRLVDSGVKPSRIHLLPNAWTPAAGLDAAASREALGVPASILHLGWVGRLSHEKGCDVFIEALSRLADTPFVVSIIGDGPQRQSLQARAEALGLADHIRWHGSIGSAGRYFSAFDAFVLSSRTEGTPMVLFEAMAAEVPIIATAVGGVPDVISPAEGLLVPAEDPAALAEAILSAARDAKAAGNRVRRAAERLEQDFAAATWVARHEEIYRQVTHT